MKKAILNTISAVTALLVAAFVCMSCEMNTKADDSMIDPTDWSEDVVQTDAWVMAGIGTSQTINSDALHLAYSEDGYSWTTLNSNDSIFTPTIGSGHIRDPYIFRKNDGTFVLLAADFTQAGQYYELGSHNNTAYWSHPSQKIYVAYSKDLITWTGEHLLQVTDASGTSGAVRHAWSPRAVYNKNDRCYDIYWVGDDSDGVNRVYVTETYDFESAHDLNDHILYDPGYSVTGAYIVRGSSKYYMFTRDNDIDFASGTGGDIQAARIDSYRDGTFSLLSGTYINRSDQSTPVYVSSPCVYQLEDNKTWIMLASEDNSTGTYACYKTTNIEDCGSWTDCSADMSIFSDSTSYLTIDSTVTRITTAELNALKAAAF